MTDQCKHCEFKSDTKKCLTVECSHHENWYTKQQQERIEQLLSRVTDLEHLEKRFQRITEALERWGWQHCTTEKELIKQIDDLRNNTGCTANQR
ncbi:MAG: hypothetical protein GY774_04875 [Planctomycetes bacterium]|nr:hypothetical protein [Planctomycetota bacterium]